MNESTVRELQDQKFRTKMIAKGVAMILVGLFVISLSGLGETIVGSLLALAGVGVVIQGVKIRV